MNKINGNIQGVRTSLLEELEGLYEVEAGTQEFIPPEMLDRMAQATQAIGREISVFFSRSGKVLDVSIGDNSSVQMPYVRKRRGLLGLSGVRAIHTHPGGSPMLSAVDIGTLISSKFDAMAAVSVKDGVATAMCVGYIGDKLDVAQIAGPFRTSRIPQRALMAEISNATQRVAQQIALLETDVQAERVMLVGLNAPEESMEELARLVDTAGGLCISKEVQNRERDNAFYIGKGKARELSLEAAAQDIDTVVFNDELTPLEIRNLEEILNVKVIDRTMLILDIFARHARSREGSMQVELAQLKYNLPRLQGEGSALSRLGGGIGTRGPGEKKIEIDRRRIRRRIFELTREIDKISQQRELRRKTRKDRDVKEVALVGYTNAGKSSLLNYLTDAGVTAEDKLFATLDPVTRKVVIPEVGETVFTDTVGFIEKLPHDLISAFRSTLEEAVNADLLLCVTDASNPHAESQMNVVDEVLESLGAGEKPRLLVLNKSDLLKEAAENTENMVSVSAKTGEGIERLMERVSRMLRPQLSTYRGKIGYERGDLLALVNQYGKEVKIDYQPDAVYLEALLPQEVIKKLQENRKNEAK